MYTSITQIRVRYGETDQMGYVYYGNYALYFEIGRVELLRDLGVSYKSMEEQGIMLPVINYQCKYLKPAYYDDLLTLKTTIKEIPLARITFYYELYNQSEDLLNTAQVDLVFIDKKSQKLCKAPDWFISKLQSLSPN